MHQEVTVNLRISLNDWFYLQNIIMQRKPMTFRDVDLLNNLVQTATVEMDPFSINIDDDLPM